MRAFVEKRPARYRELREEAARGGAPEFNEVMRSLLDARRAKVAEEFERVERVEIGEGVHEKYHRMIHRLADAYP